MRLGAAVLHYRFWPDVLPTLDALEGQLCRPDELLVVDNASGDGSVERLRRARPGLDILVAPANRGYAAGMNLAVRALRSRCVDAVLLLTHETRLDPDATTHLVAELDKDPQVGAAGPLLGWRSSPATVYSAGAWIDYHSWHTFHRGFGEPLSDWRGRSSEWVDFVDGAALLLRSDAIDSVGPMDESYFMYYEEVDYQLRLRAMGWAVACVPAAVGFQEPGRPDPALWIRNRLRLLTRHAPRPVLVRELGDHAHHAVQDMIGGRRASARDRVQGVAAFLGGRPPRTNGR